MLKLIYTGLLAFIYTVMVFLFFFSLPKKDAPAPTLARARGAEPRRRMAAGKPRWPVGVRRQRSSGGAARRLGAIGAATDRASATARASGATGNGDAHAGDGVDGREGSRRC